ncbi:hypothetical protein [Salipiger sp. PrR007]|uniref:hypothetical protein n=1 Tax=Salipiger sp. PrR007 TaxID=2706884 RepID=UPI001F42BF82|nr:hypothetical protein [Salipiger sp. PrR007]
MTQPAKDKAAKQAQPQQGGQAKPGSAQPSSPAEQKAAAGLPRPAVVPAPGQKPGPKAVTQAPARPPAGAAKPQRRHRLMLLSFLGCVVLPGILTALYLWLVAADQYASKVGFTVRQEDAASAVDLLGGLTNLSSSSSSDTDILYEFIQSQKLVSDIDKKIDLHAIWSPEGWDPVFKLEKNASIEQLLAYWGDMVRISYSAGLIEVEVRAFRPEDATLIAQTLLDESADVINELSAVARADAISYSRDELDEAVERLKVARETVTRFRNETQIIDPQIDLQSQAGLLSNLQAQEAEQIIELDLLRETSQQNDPRVAQAERRLDVIRTRISAERQKLGFEGSGANGQVFADLVGDYERLSVDREFAERAYLSALAAYDSALAEAKRKSRYLAAYMKPTSAETAEYPSRLTLLMVVSLFLFLLWSTAVLLAYSVKDRR